MRIGNSDLNYHKKDKDLNTFCPNCVKGIIETNEHFFLSCPKYMRERRKLMNKISTFRKQTNLNAMKKILGFFDEIYSSKRKTKLFKQEIKKVIMASMDYISDTGRFKI